MLVSLFVVLSVRFCVWTSSNCHYFRCVCLCVSELIVVSFFSTYITLSVISTSIRKGLFRIPVYVKFSIYWINVCVLFNVYVFYHALNIHVLHVLPNNFWYFLPTNILFTHFLLFYTQTTLICPFFYIFRPKIL